MFSEIIKFDNDSKEDEKINFLYKIFKNDFVDNNVYLNNTIHIDPRSSEKKENKEKIFWHIITKKYKGKRCFDCQRACRIKWVKQIILNFRDPKIKSFYYFEYTKKIRLYLWAYEYNFVVILQKLGSCNSYLVTSFYIDNENKIEKLEKKYKGYNNKIDVKLNKCEWF